jgi:hypothetical protein
MIRDLHPMKASNLRPLILSYAIVAGLGALITTFLYLPPASFLIDLCAPEEGDTYPATLVFLLTALMFLSPLFIYMAISKAKRTKVKTVVKADMTGIFVTRKKAFSGAMTPIPLFVNGEEVGMVDNGRTTFLEVAPGEISLHAGVGRQASPHLRLTLEKGEKVKVELDLTIELLGAKVNLRQVSRQPLGGN